jgi:hypothetical protein
MKIQFLALGAILFISGTLEAQQIPTGSPVPSGYTTAQQAASAWYRGGNNPGNTAVTNNILGTEWNSPIYFTTAGTTSAFYRMKLNGLFTNNTNQYPINGFNFSTGINTTGYLLLGNDINSLYSNKGAFSLLHLNGQDNTGVGTVQEYGYRPWMKTGITLTGNSDMSYMGLRQLGTGADVTETVISWADNAGTISGPDELTFRYTQGSGSTYNANFADPDDMDGRHIARFTGEGFMGLGNSFGVNIGSPAVTYARPMSLLHQSFQFAGGAAFEGNGFHQITYRRAFGASTDIIGQGEAATDGLRLGIDNDINSGGPQTYLNSYLRWQEASNFIIQTEDDAAPNIEANERLRITSIGALNATQNTILYDGLTATTNATRVSISESGATPLLRPKSLLHLGYDYGGLIGVQGYRKWMDLGVLTSNQRDHVWLGLKPRTALTTTVPQTYDQLDAVVAWGTDREATAAAAVDNMRFIFTGHTFDANPEGAPSVSTDGLEMMRMYPATVYIHPIYNAGGTLIGNERSYGRVGIGDFTASGVSGNPTQKLDVVGNARLRYLPDSVYMADSTVKKIVLVDETGVLRWKTVINDGFGTPCATDSSTYFMEHRKVNLNNHNFYFEGDEDHDYMNRVGIGWPCGTTLKAKIDVFTENKVSTGGSFMTLHNWTQPTLGNFTGAVGMTLGDGGNNAAFYGLRGHTFATNFTSNNGVYGFAPAVTNSYAGYFNGDVFATGMYAGSDSTLKKQITPLNDALKIVGQLSAKTFFWDPVSNQSFSFSNQKQYGFIAQEVQNVLPSIVKQSHLAGEYDASGNFIANPKDYLALNYMEIIPINTQAINELNEKFERATLSDQTIKTNVQDLTGSLDKVLAMRGVSYDWDQTVHPELNLDSLNQVGFIAQEIQVIDPRLTFVADDSLLHVEYDKVVPILAEAIQELNDSIEVRDSIINVLVTENSTQQTIINTLSAENASQQSTIDDLNNRLTQLENCLSGILPYLCQLSHSAIQANTPETQEEVRKNLNVTLSNRNAIVLDQNVPNPFAEQTIINFSIPETVKKAQIHFYDGNGRFMNSVEVIERGLGSVTVFGSDLSTGVYTYTLVADGQVVATKKMMKQ